MLQLRKGNSQNTLVLLEYNEMILPSLTFMVDPTINVRGKNTINNVRSRFVADRNSVGFARKTTLTISFVERGFERLGLDR